MIKDSSYKLIPTLVVSNFDEEQTTKLAPALTGKIKISQGKRSLENDDESRPLKQYIEPKMQNLSLDHIIPLKMMFKKVRCI